MAVERLPCRCTHRYPLHTSGKQCQAEGCGCQRWVGGWRTRWRDARGKAHSAGTKDWTRRDAEKHEREMLAQRDRGIVIVADDMTVSQLADKWMRASRQISERTRKRRQSEINIAIVPLLGSLKLSRLTEEHIEAYLDKRSESLRPSSVRMNFRCTLMPMLNFAVRKKYMLTNPGADVEPPMADHREMRFLSIEELKHLAGCFPAEWSALIMFTGIMGVRWAELWAMLPNDLTGSTVLIRGTKSKSSLRRITMPAFIVEIMDEHQKAHATQGHLWVRADGRLLGPETWRQRVWKPGLEASGLAPLRFHDLRHTAAALAVKAGAHPLLLQKRLGHATPQITLGTYGHLFPEADEAVATGLDHLYKDEDEDEK